MTTIPPYVTSAQVCARFQVSARTLSRWVTIGTFPPPTIPGSPNRWHPDAIRDYERTLSQDGKRRS